MFFDGIFSPIQWGVDIGEITNNKGGALPLLKKILKTFSALLERNEIFFYIKKYLSRGTVTFIIKRRCPWPCCETGVWCDAYSFVVSAPACLKVGPGLFFVYLRFSARHPCGTFLWAIAMTINSPDLWKIHINIYDLFSSAILPRQRLLPEEPGWHHRLCLRMARSVTRAKTKFWTLFPRR